MSTSPALSLTGLTSTGKLVYPHTRIGMVFYPHANEISALWSDKTRSTSPISIIWDPKKTAGALIDFSWTKKLGQPAGTWSATIKDVARYASTLDIEAGDIVVGDWVDISVMRNGIQFPLCRGRVENIRCLTASAGGATTRTWSLNGTDHAKVLEYPIAFTNFWARKIDECIGGFFTRRFEGKIGGQPNEIFRMILKAALNPAVAAEGATQSYWELPPALQSQAKLKTEVPEFISSWLARVGVTASAADKKRSQDKPSLWDVLVINDSSAVRGGFFNEPIMWTHAGGGIQDMINQFCNPLLNEMLYDTLVTSGQVAGKAAQFWIQAQIRERPFVLGNSLLGYTDYRGREIKTGLDSPWYSLPLWKLPHWMVLSSDTGRSDAERYNLFQLLADIGFGGNETEQTAMCLPTWLKSSVNRHGLRIFQQRSNYCCDPYKGKAQGDWNKEWAAWHKLLINWYCLNPYFTQGNFTFKLALPEVRVGDRLRIEGAKADDNWTYYVEGVTLNWRAGASGKEPPNAETNLAVTRGWKGSDNSLLQATAIESECYVTTY